MSGHCPTCAIVLPLSGEPNCYCEPPAVASPVADEGPVGTLGHPYPNEAEIDPSNSLARQAMFAAGGGRR